MGGSVVPTLYRGFVWFAVFICSAGVAYGQQDVVVTTGGDKLIGEIKSVKKTC